ncbi:MAG TPA: RNA methyltransferase [Mycobacteriales bacterium]
MQVVTDVGDARLADYRSLTDVALRRRTEPEQGLFIAEGELVIRRAVAAGFRLRSVLLSERWLPSLDGLLDGVDVYVGDEPLLQQVTGFHVHRGALASVERRPLPSPDAVAAGAHRLAVLEDVNTHTNVGAIFRAAVALGVDGVLLSPSCADPLYRRAVRVSMGAVFAVPYARAERWPDALEDLRRSGFGLLALTPDGAHDIGEVDTERPLAVVLGAEGPGVSDRVLRLAEPVRIPMAHGVDSLNVAAAAAVAFYALR